MNLSSLPVERRFTSALSVAARRMRTAFDAHVRRRGLTLSRARALLQISTNPGINQTELARFLEIEGPSVVRLLDGMERQGLIQRGAIPGDRRAKRIGLTEAAQRQVAELEEISRELGRDLVRGVSADDVNTVIRVLETVIGNLEAPV